MRNDEDFAVFILTYGRPDKVMTYDTLRKQGYTGKIYLVCSTDDKMLDEYKNSYWDMVIVFNKNDYKDTFDIGDSFKKDNVVVYARNANRDIARDLWLKYYLQLDDDYTSFPYRIPEHWHLKSRAVKNLDKIFDLFIDFLKDTPKVTAIALAQGGDFIGGVQNRFFKKEWYAGIKRKIMNTFFNVVDRPYKFYGRINEDVNCYVQNGKTGTVFLTHPLCTVNQMQTQQNSGGLSEFYLDTGTYYKSFYTILFNPSCVSIAMMWNNDLRMHHNIRWKNAVPMLIREEHKK